MEQHFLGQVVAFGGNFAPRGWALCDGTLLSIAQYNALFSIIGTIYGGDGRTTFALPDLRGRAPIHPGTGPGLTPRRVGERGGSEGVTLNILELPSHNHSLQATAAVNVGQEGKGVATSSTAASNFVGNSADTYRDSGGGGTLNAGTVDISGQATNSGGGQSHNNVQPFQVVNYIIALTGPYPSRN